MRFHTLLLSSALAFMFVSMPLFAEAQSLSAVPDPVQFIISPEVPGPYQTVQIEAQGVGSFLGDAGMVWTLDGKQAKTGVGARTFSFTTGALGQPSRVRVVITSTTQGTISREFTFLPTSVNLLWEADTSIPPFYRGKALYSPGSRVKVVAFPVVLLSSGKLASSQLSFQWQRNENLVPEQSGKGRDTFTIDGDQLQTGESVIVDVYFGQARVGHGEITIPAVDPQLLLYGKDALRGVLYDTVLPSNLLLTSKELAMKAEPYFFSNVSKKAGLLSYAWTLNGVNTSGPESKNGILTLRQTGTTPGLAAISATLQNNDPGGMVQAAVAAVQVAFGSSESSILSILGL